VHDSGEQCRCTRPEELPPLVPRSGSFPAGERSVRPDNPDNPDNQPRIYTDFHGFGEERHGPPPRGRRSAAALDSTDRRQPNPRQSASIRG